jgi:hypothetical protein
MPRTAMEANPFLLLVDPGRVIAAMEQSERLSGLNRQICRPLDRIPGAPAEGTETAADGSAAAAPGGDALQAASGTVQPND